MSQFSFNGEFRRKPKQNLGGSSRLSEQKDMILQKAREDRERRQRDREVATSIVVIQSYVRSFLVRSRVRNGWRADFDKAALEKGPTDKQLTRFNEFYNPKIDKNRLYDLARIVLGEFSTIVPFCHYDIYWQVRIRNFILACVRSFKYENSKALLLRVVNALTDYSQNNNLSIKWASSCWLHMIERADFFHEWRKFMEKEVTPVGQPEFVCSQALKSLCLSLIEKPFITLLHMQKIPGVTRFEKQYIDGGTYYMTALYKFATSFCVKVIPSGVHSSLMGMFALPKIARSIEWMKFIYCLNHLFPRRTFTREELRNILYAVLSLCDPQSNGSLTNSEFDLIAFLDCLKYLITSIDNRLAPLPNVPLSELMEDDDEFMRTDAVDSYYEDVRNVYSKLRECLNCLQISSLFDPFECDNWQRLYPIINCIIGLEPKHASLHFDFLPALAYNRNFVRSLYTDMIYNGPKTNEEISAFCWLFSHIIATLHDAEFVDSIPLDKYEIPNFVHYLKSLYTTLVFDRDSNSPMLLPTSRSIVTVLRGLHDRNTRIQMIPEEEFHFSLCLILPIDTHSIRFDENLQESEMHLPPLEMKLHRVLREFPYFLSFRDRVSVWNRMIHLDKGDRFQGLGNPRENIQIRRNFIYEDAYEKLSQANVQNLRGVVRISLVNTVGALEAGVDGGGLLREFLIEATRAAVDPNRGLFRVDSQNRIYPNPVAKKIFPDYQKHFFLMGRLVGKALYEQTHLELPFAAFFIQTCITGQVSSAVDYLATLDPSLHRNLLQLKDYQGDWNLMSIDFTLTMDELGETRVVELKENGKDIQVDSSNIIEYIHLVADYKINREMKEECRWFRLGICDVIPMLHIFSWREMQILISGSDKPIDLEDWAANINYAGGFTPEHPTIVLFWQVLSTFEEEQLRKLLKFVTSCSRPPLLGFKDLIPKFGIQNAGVTDRFPTASTCMNLLKLPELTTAKDLREKLLYVIEAEAGFELS